KTPSPYPPPARGGGTQFSPAGACSRLLQTAALALALACTGFASAQAADLTIGTATEPSAIDPQFSRTGNNQSIAQHMFDRLVQTDENLQVQPALALSWTSVDPTTWEVKLRPGVKFSDGSDLTAEDVIFSLDRAKSVPNSPAPFTGAVGSIAEMTAVDPLTIRFKTKAPTPQFIEQVGLVYIVSKKASEGKATSDFNSGAAAIGTGPYVFKQWVPGDRLVLAPNPHYWGDKPAFENVTIKFISNDAARMAALLSGSVDLIDGVPPNDVATVESSGKAKVYSTTSGRLIYLALDSARDQSPFVTGKDGQPLAANPLKDKRVRLAVSKLINRDLIIQRLLNGSGTAAGQIVPEGLGGYAADVTPEAYDAAGAKALLADSGYGDGFGLTVHSSNDRFAGDADIAQAIGQMLARGGLKINGVVTQPYNVYAGAASKQEYSAFIFSFGNSNSNSANALTNVLATYDKEAGKGAFNRARYSNPEFDAVLKQALAEFDEARRNQLLEQAARVGFGDVGIVPLYFPTVHWAARNGITYRANKNEWTLATYAEAAK
ncbi:ABC transporter substrate-binding protein, partial [Inquilinus sp. OTU3971]|uniref:ABC transporter substrate-binding protein n=1 Tax=Inquilinus sp. OTU3971 TaxID=3043855 RepID=UPI00313CD900